MSKIETKANDSRQSVDMKWRIRKGLEENVAFKEDGTMEVGKDLEVDGQAFFVGKDFGVYPGKLSDATEKRLGYYTGENTFWTFAADAGNMTSFYGIKRGDSGVFATTLTPNEEDAALSQLATNDYVADRFGFFSGEVERTFSKAKYQHTVTVTGSRPVSGGGACAITFTAYSSKSTPIDSYQDLNAAFGGCSVSASGLYSPASGTNRGVLKIDLRGGTIATDKIYYSDPSLTKAQSIALSSFGDIGFSDDVCIPK